MQCNKVPILTWWKIICRAPFSFIFVTVTMTASKNQLHLSPFDQVKWITISEWNIFIFAIIVIGISRMSRRLGRFTCWSFKSEGFKDILLERRVPISGTHISTALVMVWSFRIWGNLLCVVTWTRCASTVQCYPKEKRLARAIKIF